MSRGGHRPGAGRPCLGGTPQDEQLHLHCTEAERGELADAAAARGVSLNRFVIEAALRRARAG